MSVNSSKSQQQAQQTSTQQLDPQIKAALLDNYNRALGIANTPYQPYTGERVADFTPQQTQAQNLFSDIGTNSPGAATTQAGVNAASGVAGYSPQGVQNLFTGYAGYTPANTSAYQAGSQGYQAQGYTGQGYQAANANAPTASSQGYTPSTIGSTAQTQGAQIAGGTGAGAAAQIARRDVRDVNGGSVSQGQINQYMNPYTTDVVNTSLADLERQRQIEQTYNAAKATNAHAFGGSGADVLSSLTNDNYTRAAASQAAQLRSAGFNTALENAQQDLGRQFAANQGNQNVDLSVAGQNAGYRQQTGLSNASNSLTAALANQASSNQANLFNAGAQNQTSALNQAANNQAGQFGAAAGNTANLFNAGQGLQANLANQASQNAAGQFGATAANQAGQFGAEAANTAGQFNAGAANTANLFNTGAQNTAANLNQAATNQAGEFWANAQNSATALNATQALQAQLANQSAGIAGQGLNLQAGAQLGDLGAQQLQQALMGATGVQQSGAIQQQNQQAILDAAYQQFGDARNWPIQLQQLLNQSLGLAGNPTLTQSQGTSSGRSSSWGLGLTGGGGGISSSDITAASGGA